MWCRRQRAAYPTTGGEGKHQRKKLNAGEKERVVLRQLVPLIQYVSSYYGDRQRFADWHARHLEDSALIRVLPSQVQMEKGLGTPKGGRPSPPWAEMCAMTCRRTRSPSILWTGPLPGRILISGLRPAARLRAGSQPVDGGEAHAGVCPR